ncbi:MAG: small multi-drug export protein [Candidatus Pacebacteria bacterium]|nr:small multi-drug export protein [Candidatus Paceibacterota bacterium]
MDFNFLSEYFSPEMATFIVSMLPVSELRGSIPLAIGFYNMDPLKAYFISVIGNIIPVAIVLIVIEPVSKCLMEKSKMFNNFFSWFFARTRRKYNSKFEKWGALALITFVAIPLPVTGGWTGAIAAFVFGIPIRKALPLITLGVMIAGVIMTGLSLGVWRF